MRDVVDALLRPGDITTVAQPIIRLADGHTVGFEVLARSRSFAYTSPDKWLQCAKAVGRRVEVELACIRAAALLGPPPDDARIFVNASADLLLDSRVDDVLTLLPGHVLEVTEHEQVADYPALARRLSGLRAGGSMLAVDDVGAGYANMAHVLRLSPHFIKIDRDIVSGLHADRDRRALIAALVAFAVACGAQTIAEGVEDEAELSALVDLGVDHAQGYLIARPGPAWPVSGITGLDRPPQPRAQPPAGDGRPLQDINRFAASVADAGDLRQLARVAAEGAVGLTGLSSAALWWVSPHGTSFGGGVGPLAPVLLQLDEAALARLLALTDGVTRYPARSGAGDVAGSAPPPLGEPPTRSLLLVPLRARGSTVGLIAVSGGSDRDVRGDKVLGLELLCSHVATARLALADHHAVGG